MFMRHKVKRYVYELKNHRIFVRLCCCRFGLFFWPAETPPPPTPPIDNIDTKPYRKMTLSNVNGILMGRGGGNLSQFLKSGRPAAVPLCFPGWGKVCKNFCRRSSWRVDPSNEWQRSIFAPNLLMLAKLNKDKLSHKSMKLLGKIYICRWWICIEACYSHI